MIQRFTTPAVFVFFLLIVCCSANDESCRGQQNAFKRIFDNNSAVDFFYFKNDTKETIQLTWAGDSMGVIILITMSESNIGVGQQSDIYRSSNNGKSFEKISHNLGEKIYIKRENGLQTRKNLHKTRKIYVICHDQNDANSTLLFSTSDSGDTWKKSSLNFLLTGKLKFSSRDMDSKFILTLEKHTQTLYVSNDGGLNWKLAQVNVHDFAWSGFAADNPETMYVLHGSTIIDGKLTNDGFILSKSSDFGNTWTSILSNVRKMWVPESMQSDDFEPETKDVLNPTARFLYATHFTDEEKIQLRLSVSDDGGATFKRVHLPTVKPERFFNILDVEDDFVFLHVDEPDDTGYGTLYVSDSTGTIFSESLRRHLYPNHSPVTDFYRVSSIRGTFLATQLNLDSTLRTVITHDRGATWKPLPVPENMHDQACEKPKTTVTPSLSDTTTGDATSQRFQSPEENRMVPSFADDIGEPQTPVKVCGLQISNQFSMRSRVVASPPLSTSSARGLLLAHGHVSTHLKNTPADVYITADGGYTWHKGLNGPHHYQIANRGGLIVAVPADIPWVDVLRFSTDEGRCWHTIPLTYRPADPPATLTSGSTVRATTTMTSLTPVIHNQSSTLDNATTSTRSPSSTANESVVFTGLVTEPGGQAMTVAVYGYGTVSQRWRVAVVDFSTNGIVMRNCSIADYEMWSPHEEAAAGGKIENNGCLLGMKEFFYRLKEDALCFTDSKFHSRVSSETCTCTPADYECEYGFWREIGSKECIPNPHIPELEVCDLKEDDRMRLHELGYRRIPGDRCINGWQPPRLNQSIVRTLANCPLTKSFMSLTSKVVALLFALFICVGCLIIFVRSRTREGYPLRRRFLCSIDCKRLTRARWPRKPLSAATLFRNPSNGDTHSEIATIAYTAPSQPTPLLATPEEVLEEVDQEPSLGVVVVSSTTRPTRSPRLHAATTSVSSTMVNALHQIATRGRSREEDQLDLLEEEESTGMTSSENDVARN